MTRRIKKYVSRHYSLGVLFLAILNAGLLAAWLITPTTPNWLVATVLGLDALVSLVAAWLLHVKSQDSDRAAASESLGYHAIFEKSHLAAQIVAQDGRTLAVNKAWQTLWGISDEVLRNFIMNDYNVFEDALLSELGILALLKRAMDGESVEIESVHYDPKLIDQPGRARWVRAHAFPLAVTDGHVSTAILTFQDLTDLKEAEQRLDLAVAATQMGIWDWDLVRDRLVWNRIHAELFGIELDQFDGTFATVKKFIHPDDLDRVSEVLAKAVRVGKPVNLCYRIIRPDGSLRWLDAHGQVFFHDERPVRMLGSVVDVTDSILTRQKLAEAKEIAVAASKAKTQFLANMSHEIRTPLSVILGLADVMARDPEGTPQREKQAQTIKRNGRLLLELINEVLDLAKVETGNLKLDIHLVSLPELLSDVATSMRSRAETKGLDFIWREQGDLPATIETDPTRLRQILFNIIGNAIKFTEQGQVLVTITMPRPAPGSQNRQMICTVEDTGIGIPLDHQRHLFKPFMQVDSRNTRKYGGTGLGLDLARRLARMLGGDVELKESRPGKGSSFLISINAGKGQALAVGERSEEKAAPSTTRLDGLRILLAEDSSDMRTLASDMLGQTGAVVIAARDGIEALAKAEEEVFDLVLMDIQMPRIDGVEAMKSLRSAGFTKPIIALTAHAMPREKEVFLSEGFDDLITKPVDWDEIGARLAAFGPSSA